MNQQPYWIWYPGDFEIYHYMVRHTRRQAKDARVPAFWHVSRPELAATFETAADLKEAKPLTVISHGVGRVLLDGRNWGALNETLTIPAGSHTITVNVMNQETFPSIYVEDEPFQTGENWRVHNYDKDWKKPDTDPYYIKNFAKKDSNPAVFPFLHKPIQPVCVEERPDGILYDYGTEQFGPVTIYRTKEMGPIRISYGESKEEALEWDETILRDTVPEGDGAYEMEPRAFRCLFVMPQKGQPKVEAQLEYLDIENAATFSCDREIMNDVWDICQRTMHINAREYYLDGPKQDGWVWAGDAYQAYMAGRYLFQDQTLTRRTIRASFGRPPILTHINTINDYSSYQLISLWEYYYATGDLDFVATVWPMAKALYDFIVGRLDEKTGYVIKRDSDWIFVDWSTIDKTDPNSTEQILLWQVHRVMSWLGEALKKPMSEAMERAKRLKENIMRDFWNEDLGAFICTPTTGENFVTHHANIMAVLYDFVNDEQKEQICHNVFFNPKVPAITTPFFNFFELLAICKTGHIEEAQNFMEAYWGEMVRLGATTVWEQFDSTKKGIEHYSMYGQKFGASLCHIWGSGPIVILGQYVVGLRPTSVGGKTFVVEPKPGLYKNMKAVFPMAEGLVYVELKDNKLNVKSTIPGGTLVVNNKNYVLEPNQAVEVDFRA